MMTLRLIYCWGAVVLFAATCSHAGHVPSASIVASYPHDPSAFTQGLLVEDGMFYESTGRYGQSTLRRVDIESGRIEAEIALADDRFGEGLALVGERLYQLTWKAGIAYVYDRKTLERIGTHRYEGEGWGLTWDGRHLIMSDGSATLRLIDPQDFSVTGRIYVTENDKPLTRLNELEYVDAEILANVWYTNRIVRIDPASGRVVGALDARSLRAALPRDATRANVLNGIAWDATQRRLYLTGKYWPRLFEVAWPGS